MLNVLCYRTQQSTRAGVANKKHFVYITLSSLWQQHRKDSRTPGGSGVLLTGASMQAAGQNRCDEEPENTGGWMALTSHYVLNSV